MGKRIYRSMVFMAVAAVMASCSTTLRDNDGNRYKTARIGSQIWMTENLNVTHFRNGDTIQEAKSTEEWVRLAREAKPAMCTIENDPANTVKYGRLYNWYAVNDPRGLAPKGWHVASDDDWSLLTTYLGGGVIAALKMRVTGTSNPGGDGQSGFSGLPAGARSANGKFVGLASYGYWWSSTEFSGPFAWLRMLNYENCDINILTYLKGTGLSVRCVKN